MINALYNLGRYVVEKEQKERIDIFPDEMKLNRSKKILFVNLEKVDEDYKYDGVILSDSKDKIPKILYKGGPSRGVDFTPTVIVTDSIKKTFNGRLMRWFVNHTDSEFLNEIHDVLNNNLDSIISDLELEYNIISKQEQNNLIISISIEEGSKTKYVADYEVFQKILLSEAIERYYNLKTIGKSADLGICCLCDNEKEVYGFVLNAFGFSFSNADKKGNTPNFIQKDQWKQVPICEDCGVLLEAGKKFLEKYLSFSSFGIKYYVIPNFLFKGELKEYEEFYTEAKSHKNKTYEKGLASEEEDLSDYVNDMDDVLEFKFVFYEKTKGGGKYTDILSYVESVLPSWVMKIHDTQWNVMNDILFQEYNLKKIFKNSEGNFVEWASIKRKNGINRNNWYIAFLRDFFKTDHKYFLDVITSIIGGKSLNKDFLLYHFMKTIREIHRQNPENDYLIKTNAIESLMILMFLNELNLIKGVNKMNIGTKNEQLNQKDFFETYGEFIDTADKKASFLMGVLTKKLTAVQYMSLGTTPFMTKLWGLSLDQKKLEKLYPMIINKLREYKLVYKDLEELTSLNLLESSKNWKLSRDETSFYFTLGFTMAGILTNKKEEGDSNE